MFQDPSAQTVNPLAGFAMGLGTAIGNVALIILFVLIASPALAAMVLLWAGARWPSFGQSIIGNCIAAVVLTALFGMVLGSGAGMIGSNVSANHPFFGALPLAGIGLVVLSLFLQFRARASFSRARAAGIVCAVLTPIVFVLINQ